MPFVVAIDADQIQPYVFASLRIREARGGSQLLRELNDREAVSQRLRAFSGRLIYAGGGSVNAVFAVEGDAARFICAEQDVYRRGTQAASCTGAIIEVSDDDLAARFGEVVGQADDALRQAKVRKILTADPWGFPLAQICPSCGMFPASRPSHVERGSYRCYSCWAKEEASGSPGIGQPVTRRRLVVEFEDWLRTHRLSPVAQEVWARVPPGSLQAPDDLDALRGNNANLIALIACDGNRVGQVRKALRTESDFADFSGALQETTRDAVFRAVAESGRPLREAEKWILPVEFILVGGDDAVLVCTADVALPLAREICIRLQQGMAARGYQIGMAAGVAIAKSHHPLHALHRLACELLRSAKRRAAAESPPASALDFQVVTTSSTNSLPEVRLREMTVSRDGEPHDPNREAYHLYRRPLVISATPGGDEVGRLLQHVNALHGIPRTPLRAAVRALRQGYDQGLYAYLTLLARLPDDGRRLLNGCMAAWGAPPAAPSPWMMRRTGEWEAPLADIVEVMDFAGNEEAA